MDNGALRRVLKNHNKRVEFEEMVAQTNSLGLNVWIKKYGCLFFLPIAFVTITGKADLSVPFILIYSSYLWNSLYINYYVRKTKTPSYLLPEPPKLYLKFYEKFYWRAVHIRRYGTKATTEETTQLIKKAVREVYAEESHSRRAVALAVGSLVGTAIGTDMAYGNLTGQTPIMSRIHSFGEHGWWSYNAKAQRRASQLKAWGVDVESLCHDGSKRLDDVKVNALYDTMRDERYKTPLKQELTELKAAFAKNEAILAKNEAALAEKDVILAEMRSRLERLESERVKPTLEEFDNVKSKEGSSIE